MSQAPEGIEGGLGQDLEMNLENNVELNYVGKASSFLHPHQSSQGGTRPGSFISQNRDVMGFNPGSFKDSENMGEYQMDNSAQYKMENTDADLMGGVET